MAATNSRPKRLQVILWGFLFLIWLFVLCVSLLGVLSAVLPDVSPERVDTPSTQDPIHFSNVDWNADIYENPRWMELDRQIYFGTRDIQQALNEENLSANGKYAEFFYRYFNAVIEGDFESYATFFSDKSVSAPPMDIKFTKQMLYNISVYEWSEENVIDADGNEIPVKDFIVTYRILENNGTFRDDLKSGALSEQYFRLTEDAPGQIAVYEIAKLEQVSSPSPVETSEISWSRVAIFSILFVFCIAALIYVLRVFKRRKAQK